MVCHKCKDKCIIKQNGKLIVCTECITKDKLIDVIKLAAEMFYNQKDFITSFALQSVLALLPNNALLATLEAEDRGLSNDLTEVMRQVFDVLPLK